MKAIAIEISARHIKSDRIKQSGSCCCAENVLQSYRLIKFGLFLQVELHDTVVVIDTVAMEVVHLGCG